MGLDTHPSYVTAVGAVFLAFCPVVVALRFYTRAWQRAGLGPDDWLTLPALLMVIGCAVDVIVGVRLKAYAYPTPAGASHSSSYGQAQKLSWAFFMMQILSMGFIKLSFVFFFRRIFVDRRPKGIANMASLLAATIVVLWTLAFFFWTLFACGTHFSGRWTTHTAARAYCPTDNMSNLALAISDMLTDVMVLCLPIPSVFRLKMKMSRKLAVLAIFGLGALSLVASIIRLAIFVHATKSASSSAVGKTIDIQLLITQGSYWPMLESGLALIACCLPVLNSLLGPLHESRKEQSHRPDRGDTLLQMRPKQSQSSSIDASGMADNLQHEFALENTLVQPFASRGV